MGEGTIEQEAVSNVEPSDIERPLLLPAPDDLRGPFADPAQLTPPGASVLQTVISLFNILMGIGILSLPYAMSLSGSAGVAAVVLCCFLFCTSGKCISWGMDSMPSSQPQSYPQLGQHALGVFGQRLVTGFAMMDLIGGSAVMMIVLWSSLQMLLADSFSPEHLGFAIVGISLLFEIPLCAMGSFRFLAVFSFVGCASTIIVMLLVVALPALDPERECVPQVAKHSWLRPQLVPAMGIFALSVAGHSTFPSVRAGMATPSAFPRALNIAYTLMAAVLAAIACAGYWYWGDLAHVLVTEDFQLHSPYAHVNLAPHFGIFKAVHALVVLNAATTLPLLVLSLQDLVHSFWVTAPEPGQGPSHFMETPGMRLVARMVVLAGITAVAYTGRNVLGAVESIAGALCAVQCSLILPTMFFVAIHHKHKRMRARHWLGLGAMLAFGALLVVLTVAQALEGLLRLKPGAVSSLGAKPGSSLLWHWSQQNWGPG